MAWWRRKKIKKIEQFDIVKKFIFYLNSHGKEYFDYSNRVSPYSTQPYDNYHGDIYNRHYDRNMYNDYRHRNMYNDRHYGKSHYFDNSNRGEDLNILDNIFRQSLSFNDIDQVISLLSFCKEENIKFVSNYNFDDLIKSKDFDTIEILIDNKILDISYHDYYIMIKVIEVGNLNFFKYFVSKYNLSLVMRNDLFCRMAVKYNKIDIIYYLLSKDIVNPTSSLIYTIDNNNMDLFNILMGDRRVNPSFRNNELLLRSCGLGYIDIVKILLKDKRIDLSIDNNSIFIEACKRQNNKEIVDILLKDKRINLVDKKHNSLLTVYKYKDLTLFYMLLKDGRFDPSINNNKIVKYACNKSLIKMLKALLNTKRIDASIDNNKCLRSALYHNHNKIVDILLKDGKVFKTLDDDTRTYLTQNKLIPNYTPRNKRVNKKVVLNYSPEIEMVTDNYNLMNNYDSYLGNYSSRGGF